MGWVRAEYGMNTLKIDVKASGGGWDEALFPSVHRTLEVAFDFGARALWHCAVSCEVSVLLCDDAQISAINRGWRDKEGATNVLSFPQYDDIVLVGKPLCLGDIILSFETICRESVENQVDFDSHFRHLLVHGFLHLAGFEHESDSDAEIMQAMETKILNKLRE